MVSRLHEDIKKAWCRNVALICVGSVATAAHQARAQNYDTTYSFSGQFSQGVSATFYPYPSNQSPSDTYGPPLPQLGTSENWILSLNIPAGWSGVISSATNANLLVSIDMYTTVGNTKVMELMGDQPSFSLSINNGTLDSWGINYATDDYLNQQYLEIGSGYDLVNYPNGYITVFYRPIALGDYTMNTGDGGGPIVGVTSIVPESSTNVLLGLGAVVVGASILSRKRASPSPNGPAG